MTTLENRCPHGIAVVDKNGRRRLIERTEPPVRIETVSGCALGVVDGIALHASPWFKSIANLPPYRCDVIVIVSQIVALAVSVLLPDRDDVVYPGTAPNDGARRNPGKGVVNVSRLIRAV